jgi:hypothetical protein
MRILTPSHHISSHHIRSFSLLRRVGVAWLFCGRQAACDVQGAYACMHACMRASQRLQHASLRTFHTWRWPRRWWREESATTWKTHGRNESCLQMYLLRDRRVVGGRVGSTYVESSGGSIVYSVGGGTGFRIHPSSKGHLTSPARHAATRTKGEAECVACSISIQ